MPPLLAFRSDEPDDGVVPEGPPLGDRTDDDRVWSVSRKARLREHLLMKLFARLMTVPVAPPPD